MRGGEVAQVDGARAVVGILIGGGAADADGGVGACVGKGWLEMASREKVWVAYLPVMMMTLSLTRLGCRSALHGVCAARLQSDAQLTARPSLRQLGVFLGYRQSYWSLSGLPDGS